MKLRIETIDRMTSTSKASLPKILIVDNDSAFRLSLMKIFKKDGYKVALSSNGDEASQLMQTEYFPLVILDLKMPGKPGLDLLHEIRRTSPNTKVIVVTVLDKKENYSKVMDAGAFAFLQKPVKRKVILDCARKALTSY